MSVICGGCAPGPVSGMCRGCFERLGIIKVHWECWYECNLSCPFCYRTNGSALTTKDARKMLRIVATSGAKHIVFAGGDPSLRRDIIELIEDARSLNLRVELQTNAQHIGKDLLEKLISDVEVVGLSLDGPDANTHDTIREKPGNFDSVLKLLQKLQENNVPVIIRSLVTKLNYHTIPDLSDVLKKFPNIVRWSLLEFSPVGEGFLNRERYMLDKSTFELIVEKVRQAFGKDKLDVYTADKKIGTYALITPSGLLYGVTDKSALNSYPTIGSILEEHLSVLSERLPFSAKNHGKRYSGLGSQIPLT